MKIRTTTIEVSVNSQPARSWPVCLFWCPGCKTHMWFAVGDGSPWTWNGDSDRPTVSPSIQSNNCHLYLTDGKIQFLGDCAHELRGQTIEMEEIDW